ncbi:MAG: aldehyde dehydrogenase (NADP(+)) [Gemmatimonadaceae bacterium]
MSTTADIDTNVKDISGNLLIAGDSRVGSGAVFRAVNPITGQNLEPVFREATVDQVAEAVEAAHRAYDAYSVMETSRRSEFLRAIADELLAAGMPLLERASLETALPIARLEGERARTVHQLRLMADVIDEGSWVEARIDTGDASRTPLPKPDLRRMLVPLGPVAVFSASNFPFAYSIAGGDTASAFAAGCTVVCKAHPAHPGTSEMTARALYRAAERCNLPAGVFSMVHGWSHESGVALVKHPHIQAVGFTGSLRGGRAIFDAANSRAEPIPVYAEMGSVNPVFLLPSAVKERAETIAQGLANSMTQGVGQFCTNPGVIVGVRSESFSQLSDSLAGRIGVADGGVMLYEGLFRNFTRGVQQSRDEGATVLAQSPATAGPTRAQATLLGTSAARFIEDANLRAEMFGPASILVTGESIEELEQIAATMEGQLTASIHGTERELAENARLITLLQRKVGRVIFNGYPTGVEVGHAIVHGGPYPASSDSRTTAVGSASISRFARPVCFQNFPETVLAVELHNKNTRGIWRMVNGEQTRGDVG